MIARATDPRWVEAALCDLDALLVDHAHCERKAASTALALVSRYCDRPELVRALSALAIEELGHFRAVVARLRSRGCSLAPDRGNRYAKALHAQIRSAEPDQLIDRLLVAGLIEARSHERLELLAHALREQPEGRLYARLARAERGHAALFVKLARGVARSANSERALEARLADWVRIESEIAFELPPGSRIH